MQSARAAILLLVLLIVSATPAFAQEKRLGFVIAYPTSAGVSWKLNDRFTIRGDGALTFASTENKPPVTSSVTLTFGDGQFSVPSTSVSTVRQAYQTTTAAIGVSALITLSRVDRLATYVAPRVALGISRTRTEIEYQIIGLNIPESVRRLYEPEDFTITTKTPTASAVFGASAEVHERFHVFGEAGVAYSWSTIPGVPVRTVLTSGDAHSHTVGVRSGIGAVIYF